jgi:hypothetical protein
MIILAHRENHLNEVIDFAKFHDKMYKSLQLRYSYSTLQLIATFQDLTALVKDDASESKGGTRFCLFIINLVC